MSDIISFDRDIKPLRKNFFGMGGMNPEDTERFADAYRRDLNPLLEANIKDREDRRRRKREDFIFKQQKNKFRQEKQNQKLIRQTRQDDPVLSQELADITEMDDPKAAMAELLSWTVANSGTLRSNPSLSNTQVMVSNILKSKAEEESSNEMLKAMQIESFIAAGDFETAASMTQGIKNSTIVDAINRKIEATRNARSSAEIVAQTEQQERQDKLAKEMRDNMNTQLTARKEDWEEASKILDEPKDFKGFIGPDATERVDWRELTPFDKLSNQPKATYPLLNMVESAITEDRMFFADFQGQSAGDILKDPVRGNQLLKLVHQYYRLGGGPSRGGNPTVNAGE